VLGLDAAGPIIVPAINTRAKTTHSWRRLDFFMFSLQFSRLHMAVMLLVFFHMHTEDLRRSQLNVSNEYVLMLFPCFTVFKSLHELTPAHKPIVALRCKDD